MRLGRRSADNRGIAICDRTGLVCDASQRVRDVRGGWVRPEDADITPGFGTWHPRDHPRYGRLSDPTPIPNARPETYVVTVPADDSLPPSTSGDNA